MAKKADNNVLTQIFAYIFVFFALLAALFGGQIMSFIFGQLGPEAAGLTVGDAAYNASLAIQNESLQAIVVYAEGSSTQMNTLSIAVILLLLISIFFIFWKIFISDGGKKGSGMMGGNFASS